MFTRRAVLAAVPAAAIFFTGVFDGHHSARAEDTVQAALDRREARIRNNNKAIAEEERLGRCIKFVSEHGGAIWEPTRENICDQAREIAKKQGITFSAS